MTNPSKSGLSPEADALYHDLVDYLGREDHKVSVMIDALSATINAVLLQTYADGLEKTKASLGIAQNMFHNFCLLMVDRRFMESHRMDGATFNAIMLADSQAALKELGVRMDDA